MKIIPKVGAFVVRKKADGSAELLLFTHVDFPEAPIQIPGGTMEPGEEPLAAALRELFEEAGIGPLPLLRQLGVSEVPSVVHEGALLRRHCYLFDGSGLPDHWVHRVTGSGEDEALRFEYRWHRIAPDFRLSGDLGHFLNPSHLPELYAAPEPFALLLNGSINAGKTTVARALCERLPDLAHVEVDALGDFLPSALSLEEKIPLNLRNAALVARTFLDAGFPVVITYPLDAREQAGLAAALQPYPVHTYTLSPPLEVALRNRGGRALTAWEEAHIRHHDATGIPRPYFGVVIDNSTEPPQATAARILAGIGLGSAAPVIRTATHADAPAIARIHVETWRSAYQGIIASEHLDALSIEQRTRGWEKNLGENRDAVLIAEQAGKVVGWVSFGPCRDEGETHQAEIYAVYIDAAVQRSGIGRALMAEAERRLAVTVGTATRFSLWVLARNIPARRFYERLGYAPSLREKQERIGGEAFTELRYEKTVPDAAR